MFPKIVTKVVITMSEGWKAGKQSTAHSSQLIALCLMNLVYEAIGYRL